MSHFFSTLLLFLLIGNYTVSGQSSKLISNDDATDSLDLRSLMTYTEEELDNIVDVFYQELDLTDSIPINELYQNLSLGKAYDLIDFEEVIERYDWKKVSQNIDWNGLMKNFDWSAAFDTMCAMGSSLFGQGPNMKVSPDSLIRDMSIMPPSDLLGCFNSNIMDQMESMDIPCFMEKLQKEGFSTSREGICAYRECLNLEKMFGSVDWDCMFKAFDLNLIMDNFKDFNPWLDRYDSTKVTQLDVELSKYLEGNPMLKQLNMDSLYKYMKVDNSDFYNYENVNTIYTNFYKRIIDDQLSVEDKRDYLEGAFTISKSLLPNYVKDSVQVKYMLAFQGYQIKLISGYIDFKDEEVYESQVILKDIIIHLYLNNLLDKIELGGLQYKLMEGRDYKLKMLISILQNIGHNRTQIGKYTEALQYLQNAAGLSQAFLSKLSFPNDSIAPSIMNSTYSDAELSQLMADYGVSAEMMEVEQSNVSNNRHPEIINELIEKNEFDKAIEYYWIIKDLLLLNDANIGGQPDFTLPSQTFNKIMTFNTLKGIYENVVNILENPKNENKEHLEEYKKVGNLLDKFQIDQRLTFLYSEMGATYAAMKNYEGALDAYQKAWTALKALPNLDNTIWIQPGAENSDEELLNKIPMIVAIIANKANIHILRKEYTAAADFLKEGLEFLDVAAAKEKNISTAKAQLVNLERDKFELHAALGSIALINGQSETGFQEYQRCQQIAKKWKHPLHAYKADLQMGEYYQLYYQPDSVLHYLQSALRKVKVLKYKQALPNVYIRMANLYQKEGMLDKAMIYYDSCKVLADTYARFDLLTRSNTLQGFVYIAKNDFQKALIHFEESIKIIEDRVFPNVLGENSRRLAIKDGFSAYEGAINSLIKLGREEKAFQYLQQAKARTLNELLASTALKADDIPADLKTEKQDIIAQLNINQRLLAIYPDSQAILKKGIDLLTQMEIVDEKIRTTSPEYARLLNAKIVNIKTVQQKLKPDQAFLEYFHGNNMYAFVIKKDTFQVFNLGKSFPVQKELSTFKNASDSINSRITIDVLARQKLLAEMQSPTQKLYTILMDSIIKHTILNDVKHLIISPDDALYLIPFELLYRKENGLPKYLLSDFTISYFQSATTFAYINEGKKKNSINPEKLLVINKSNFEEYPNLGNLKPLDPSIFNSFSNKTDFLVEEKATLETLSNTDWKNYRYIYISTHGQINPTPELSYLALTNSQLSLYNTFNLEGLQSELIILSACQTAKGTFQRGSGIMGFTRGLMHAGTGSVIISLWSVDDNATKLFFQWFFQFLETEKSIKKALNKTKQKFIASKKYNHPFYWAPFVYFGV